MRSNPPVISQIVYLEIQYLFEVDRIRVESKTVIETLQGAIGLRFSEHPFLEVVKRSLENSWTRDPFDRVIASDAALGDHRLLTKDETIRAHYRHASWP